MKVPELVPVMPLPNAILFPRVLLPLYIFESHYRKMLADCLEGDRMFAVALLREGWEQEGHNPVPYPVASVGMIRASVGRGDGTSNVVLEGTARVIIRNYVRVQPYRVARIERLASLGTVPAKERDPLLATIAKLATARAEMGTKVPKVVLNSLRTVKNASYLSDLASYMLLDNYHEKQLMLETLDVNQRFDKLIDLLQKQIRQFNLWKKLQGDLPNENVGDN